MAVIRRDRKKDTPLIHTAIESTAQLIDIVSLAKRHGLPLVPLDIKALIRLLGINVVVQSMDDDISGHLEEKEDGWRITVNALHHPKRQRFTLAHELAHYVLHRHRKHSFIDRKLFRSTESNPMEIEANRYAASLLMPEGDFRAFVRDSSSKVEDLAAYFEVSALAVRVRAKELGFSGHEL